MDSQDPRERASERNDEPAVAGGDAATKRKDPREANRNIRKAQGEDSALGESFEKHRPAIDRDR